MFNREVTGIQPDIRQGNGYKIYRSEDDQRVCDSCEQEKTAREYVGTYLFIIFYTLAMGILLYDLLRRATKSTSEIIKPVKKDKSQTTTSINPRHINYKPQNKDNITNISSLAEVNSSEDDLSDLTITEGVSQTTSTVESTTSTVKVIPSRKNWHISSTTAPALLNTKPAEVSTTIVNKQILAYAINKNGRQIGTLSIVPALLADLSKEEQNTLKQICSRGLVITGKSEGKKGLIFKDKDKIYKLKDCTKDYRFFAHHLDGDKSNHFVVNAFKPKHKSNNVIRY